MSRARGPIKGLARKALRLPTRFSARNVVITSWSNHPSCCDLVSRTLRLKPNMRNSVTVLCGLIFVLLYTYIGFFYQFPDPLPTLSREDKAILVRAAADRMGEYAITASALQENTNLLTTLSIGLGALFGFSVSRNFDSDSHDSYISVILATAFGVSLTFVAVYAYGVYQAIAVQTDTGLFYLNKIEPLLTIQMRWVMSCAALSVGVFCWRCTKRFPNGGA